MSDSEVQQTKNVLGGLFRRPMKTYEDLLDQTITIIPSPHELLYLRNCLNCKFTIAGPCAKTTIEQCHDIEVDIQDRVLSGTMEVMYSEGLTVRIPRGHKLPTISVDNSNNCHFHLHDKSAIGMIHTVWVEDVVIHLDPPHAPEYNVEHPLGEEGEFITKYGDDKLYTAKGIRGGGGYLCTVEEKEIADRKKEELDRKMTDSTPQTNNEPTPPKAEGPKDTPTQEKPERT